MTWLDLFDHVALPLIVAASGLAGVLLGGLLTWHYAKKERQQRFIRDQLAEFYSPMLAIRQRLRAKGETRVKISDAARGAWPQLVAEGRRSEEKWAEFDKIIEHNNRQLEQELLPLYRQMIDLFTIKMYLAESSTRSHFSALVEFVELWDRRLGGSLPNEVAEKVGANESALKPLYEDLENNFERLQADLRE